ncbi:uncharacterized protein LOC143429963 [Xylocopa sonorina]|uniref:uncharacterized protein LOC143429963 n=1 Tax=Xylocopa sonorina TaxID=1818115 RepID=UPI00403AD7EF
MKQVDSRKSNYAAHSYLEGRNSPDSCWKHPQKRSQSFPVGRSSKNPDSVENYCFTIGTKPQRSHACSNPVYAKYTPVHSADASHLQGHCKPNRDKRYPSNFSSTRKSHYDDELVNIEKLKLINEESRNITEDNVEENVEGNITDDGDGEFLDKDYEEQEADDEIDDESDASPQARRGQRASRNETLLRQQRWRSMEHPDARRLRCQQRVAIVQNHLSPPRYYHEMAEHEVPVPLSEEDFVRRSLRSPSRRKPAEYRQWSSSRNEPDRYDATRSSIQTPRRVRTKPDVDRLMESEFGRIRRCNRCGNLSSKKSESPVKNGCRFDERASLPVKEPIGDEPDGHQQAFCGRCNLRHSTKTTNDPIDVLPSMHVTKSRRSRDVKSPTIYGVTEQVQDKLSPDYSRSSSRYQRKPDAFPEKSKRSLHTSHCTPRLSPRYVE